MSLREAARIQADGSGNYSFEGTWDPRSSSKLATLQSLATRYKVHGAKVMYRANYPNSSTNALTSFVAVWSDEPAAAKAAVGSPTTAEAVVQTDTGTVVRIVNLLKDFVAHLAFPNPTQWFDLDPASSDEELEGNVYWKFENTLTSVNSLHFGTLIIEWDLTVEFGQ